MKIEQGPLYVEKIIEDNLPSVEVALADLKAAWNESLIPEEKFKKTFSFRRYSL